MHRHSVRVHRAVRVCSLLAVSLGLASSACIFSPPDGDDPDPPPELDRRTRAATLEYYEKVWRHMLYADYEKVLHDGYEFFPRSEDADDFPWLPGDSWSRTIELGMAFNMFDENFTGDEPPVDAIELELTVQDERLLDAGEQRYEITCFQVGRVMWTATDGKSFDTRITLELVPDPDEPDLWQIVRQAEIPLT